MTIKSDMMNDMMCHGLVQELGLTTQPKNVRQAIEYYQQAISESSDARAMYRLAMILRTGCNEKEFTYPPNIPEACRLFKRAVETAQHVNSMIELAKLYTYGARGVEPDLNQALKLYENAIRLRPNAIEAKLLLAVLLQQNEQVQDLKRSAMLYEQVLKTTVDFEILFRSLYIADLNQRRSLSGISRHICDINKQFNETVKNGEVLDMDDNDRSLETIVADSMEEHESVYLEDWRMQRLAYCSARFLLHTQTASGNIEESNLKAAMVFASYAILGIKRALKFDEMSESFKAIMHQLMQYGEPLAVHEEEKDEGANIRGLIFAARLMENGGLGLDPFHIRIYTTCITLCEKPLDLELSFNHAKMYYADMLESGSERVPRNSEKAARMMSMVFSDEVMERGKKMDIFAFVNSRNQSLLRPCGLQ